MNFPAKNFLLLNINKNICKSVVYFNLSSEIIKENCNFAYNFNKTDIKPAVLVGRSEIILGNGPNNKHIKCNISNDIPDKISSFPYALFNRNVLCNFPLESLVACHNAETKLVMYFTVNTAFVNYLNNLTNSFKISTFSEPDYT